LISTSAQQRIAPVTISGFCSSSTGSSNCVCEVYQIIIYINKVKSAIKPGTVIQREQVFVFDSRMAGYLKRIINSPLRRHLMEKTTVPITSRPFNNQSRELCI